MTGVGEKSFFGESGFSLVETLVATFIFALVSASGVAILSGYEGSRLKLAEADAQITEFDQTKALLRDDFFTAYNRPTRGEFGGTLVAFEAGHHMSAGTLLRLVRGGNPSAKLFGGMSAMQRVEYALLNGALVRRTYDRTDVLATTEYVDQQILSGVQAVSIRLLAEGFWVEEWGTLESTNGLPRLAEITITFASDDDVKMIFLVGNAA